ncbi:MAG TPA: RNA methyltransferase [Chitinivibrionales bacterium]|nr:RNA methyltransferase [Chitinivibrionales bacterium]
MDRKGHIILFGQMNPRDNIIFILVGTQTPGNIGACCRALTVTGFSSLRLVKPVRPLPPAKTWMAHGSTNVLESAKKYSSTIEAVSDLHYLIGTTQRDRRRTEKRLASAEAAKRLFRIAASGKKAGMIFGSEQNGLSNGDLELCDAVSTIPTAVRHPSVNLAQAVMVYAYEVFLASGAALVQPANEALAPVKQERDHVWRLMASTVDLLEMREREKVRRFLRPHLMRASRSELRFFNALYDALMKKGMVGKKRS